MKFKALSLAILSTLLFSCEKKEETPPENQTPATQEVKSAPAQPATAFNRAEFNEKIKARYNKGLGERVGSYQSLLNGNNFALLSHVEAGSSDFTPTETGATGRSTLTLKLNPLAIPDLPSQLQEIHLTSRDTFTYNEALLAKGIDAQIDHQIEITDELQKQLSLDEAKTKTLREALAKLHLQTNLLSDGHVQSVASVEPFGEQKGGPGDYDFKGLRMENTVSEANLTNPYAGKSLFEFKGLDITGRKGSVSVRPFNGGGEIDNDGTGQAKYGPLEIVATETDGAQPKENKLRIAGIEGQLKNFRYDNEIFYNTGSLSFQLKDFSIDSAAFGGPLKLMDVQVSANTEKTADKLMNSSSEADFILNGEEIAQKFMFPLVVKNLKFKVETQNFDNPGLMEPMQKLVSQLQQRANAEARRAAKASAGQSAPAVANNDKAAADAMMAMLRNMTKNQTSIKVDLSSETNSGTVKAGFGFKGRADAPVEEFGALIQKALLDKTTPEEEKKAPELAMNLFDFDVNVEVPRALLDVFGTGDLVELMGKGVVSEQNGIFTFKLQHSAAGTQLNGKPIKLQDLLEGKLK